MLNTFVSSLSRINFLPGAGAALKKKRLRIHNLQNLNMDEKEVAMFATL
jgi:hypothetical protein